MCAAPKKLHAIAHIWSSCVELSDQRLLFDIYVSLRLQNMVQISRMQTATIIQVSMIS